VEPPFIEITPEAVAQLKQIVKTKNVKDLWWLRITIKPGGCQGMRSFLDLDTAGTEPGDFEYRCGDVRCLAAADHDFLIQGAQIGWTQNEKEAGFSVTFPNKTEENRKKTSKWIDDEFKAWQDQYEKQTEKGDVGAAQGTSLEG
jgi:iron-sulfur cluster assembly protein